MIEVEVKGFDKVLKNLTNGTSKIRAHFVTALRNSVTVITVASKSKAPVATGNLRRSIVADVNERETVGIVGLDYPGKEYGLYVEKGTRPHFPPMDALGRWAAQKGIPVFAVARSIARKGTKPQPFMIPAYEKNKTFIKNQFARALDNIVKSASHGNR